MHRFFDIVTHPSSIRVDAQVKMHMYVFLVPALSLTYKGPAKSVPMCVNSDEDEALSSCSSPILCTQDPTRCL